MTNAFDWKGKPSIFTTCKDRANFIGINHDRAKLAEARTKASPLTLPGSSHNLPPHQMRRPTRD